MLANSFRFLSLILLASSESYRTCFLRSLEKEQICRTTTRTRGISVPPTPNPRSRNFMVPLKTLSMETEATSNSEDLVAP